MRRGLLTSVVTAILISGTALAGPLAPVSAGADESTKLRQTIPVNLVFLGYDDLDREKLTAELPEQYEPIIRFPSFLGAPARDVGLHYDFTYNVVDAGRGLEDQFFTYLAEQGETQPRTAYQQNYNDQRHNRLDVADQVLSIDAPTTERWLKRHAGPSLKISENSYTVYFVNWYSRNDFKFHVYTKTDEPDPDTGHNFGLRPTRKLIAWGGTDSRLWFFDPSAGPEYWSGSWNVDDADLDGDAQADYRIPPIWEYADGAYRDPALLYSDLGKLARYVGINLLFTSSPLYAPLTTSPEPGGAKVVHIQMLQADPASDGFDYLDTRFALAKWQALQPYHRWRLGTGETDPIDPVALRSLNIFARLLVADDCWNDFGTPDAQLSCHFEQNRSAYVPSYGPRDYVAPLMIFNGVDDQAVATGLNGFSDNNWVDGTQTFSYQFGGPLLREAGVGFTATAIHEVGHHLGLSHPHDGYDSELETHFFAAGDTYFARSGDQVSSVMGYVELEWDFSRFDADNLARWEVAGRLGQTNALLADVRAVPGASAKLRNRLLDADRAASAARSLFARWDYAGAVRKATRSYELAAAAARTVGLDPSASLETRSVRAPRPDVARYLDAVSGVRTGRP